MKSIYPIVLFGILLIPLSAIIPIRGADVWYVQYLASMSAFSLGVTFVLWKFSRVLSLFTLLCWFSAIFISNHGNLLGILNMIHINFACLAVYGISQFRYYKSMQLLKMFLVLVAIQGVWSLMQYFGIDPVFEHNNNISGLSGSRNQLGVFFAVMTPLVLSLNPYLMGFVLLGIAMSGTSTAWVGMIVGVVAHIVLNKPKYVIWILIALIPATMLFYVKFENINTDIIDERAQLWKHSIKQTVEGKAYVDYDVYGGGPVGVKKVVTTNPMFGFGLGNFPRISKYTQKEWINEGHTINDKPTHRYLHAHNDFIELFFELGYLGLFWMLFMVSDLIKKFKEAKKTDLLKISFMGVVVQMVCSLGVYTVHTAVSGMLLVIFYGIFLGEVKNGQNSTLAQGTPHLR